MPAFWTYRLSQKRICRTVGLRNIAWKGCAQMCWEVKSGNTKNHFGTSAMQWCLQKVDLEKHRKNYIAFSWRHLRTMRMVDHGSLYSFGPVRLVILCHTAILSKHLSWERHTRKLKQQRGGQEGLPKELTGDPPLVQKENRIILYRIASKACDGMWRHVVPQKAVKAYSSPFLQTISEWDSFTVSTNQECNMAMVTGFQHV